MDKNFEFVKILNYDKAKVNNYKKKINKDFLILDFFENLSNEKIKNIFIYDEYSNHLINLKFKYWNNDLINTFNNNKKKILKQFLVDFPRMNLYCNGHLVEDPDYFIFYIKNKFNNIFNNILIFLNQSILAIPFELITKSLNKNYQLKYYLGEISNKNKNKKNFNIYVNTINDISFNFKKRMRIFTLLENGNDKTVSYVKIKVKINPNLKYSQINIKFIPI